MYIHTFTLYKYIYIYRHTHTHNLFLKAPSCVRSGLPTMDA